MKKSLMSVVLAVSLAAATMLLGACGDDGGDTSTSKADSSTTVSKAATGTVNASLGEYFIKLDKSTVPSGRVTFKVANDGKIRHEFVVIKTDLAPDKLPVKDGEADEEVGPSPGEIGGIAPGKSDTLTVDLKPGKYVLICNLPGHYKAGQYTGLIVE